VLIPGCKQHNINVTDREERDAPATTERDDELPEVLVRFGLPLKPHSRFWTCSRICSIATFISTETLVSSSAADFEPSVLASRSNS
jgi:hypothetical protein